MHLTTACLCVCACRQEPLGDAGVCVDGSSMPQGEGGGGSSKPQGEWGDGSSKPQGGLQQDGEEKEEEEVGEEDEEGEEEELLARMAAMSHAW